MRVLLEERLGSSDSGVTMKMVGSLEPSLGSLGVVCAVLLSYLLIVRSVLGRNGRAGDESHDRMPAPLDRAADWSRRIYDQEDQGKRDLLLLMLFCSWLDMMMETTCT